ncbi:hypothetical protein MOVS_10245 [Moraxella ovis]|uniref:Serine aminopeptidase S33 domain-containing protein n=2 Tax=Moraxella ovis TaxID=29433 RepID=A0ABM6BEU9_9GAMM|nr:alpha/beta hydrolase [Moraxella ovis]ANB92286.1 hypothetical protein MOVS_10245 [Moraxella ovis]
MANIQMFKKYLISYQNEILSARHYIGVGDTIILLHGAGETNQSVLEPVAKILQNHNYNVISFDYSGHGESSHHNPSSVAIKTEQALTVINYFKCLNIHLFAWSMSGQIAVNLLKYFPNIQSLTLFSPALYAKDIMDIEFGENFKLALREQGNWHRTNAKDLLPKFQGKLTLIRPKYDPVIPNGVSQIYKEYSNPDLFQEIILENAPHTLGAWFNENPNQFLEIFKIIRYRLK